MDGAARPERADRGATVHRAAARCERRDGHRPRRRRDTTTLRSSPATSACCLRRWTNSSGSKLEAVTLARSSNITGRRISVSPRRQARSMIPTIRSVPTRRRTRCGSLKNVAEWFSSIRGRRKDDPLLQRGHRLRHLQHDPASTIRRRTHSSAIFSDIVDTISATARSNVSIYAIDPRGLTTLGEDTIGDRRRWLTSADSSIGIGLSSLRNELQMSQDSLRSARRRDRRLCGR